MMYPDDIDRKEFVASDYGSKRASAAIKDIDYIIELLNAIKEDLPRHYAAVKLGSVDRDSGDFIYNETYIENITGDLDEVKTTLKIMEDNL